MNTKELVTFIKRVNPSWSRQDILEFIDNVQKTIFGVPTSIMKYRDVSTGRDKILTTTQGTYEYELSASSFGADIQFIKSIYSSSDGTIYYDMYSSDNVYASVANAIGTTNAKILFSNDPGDCDYYIECYKRPTTLLSESIDLAVPSELVIPGLFHGVTGLIEMLEHGESNAYDRFIADDMIKMRARMNDQGQTLVYYNEGGGY